ncbi:MAG: hypothetical protein K8U57_27645 [Planctomycetes bacterium]|nr:hypothetical protein [Planctomycetota bacterium]
MTPEAVEQGDRRAEIEDGFVVFFRVTGNVRRSKQAVWWVECENIRRARWLAREWVIRGKLGKPVLH